ncbi:MAG: glycoside hydrolase family 88 protein [Bacteroidales bacterium]|jgi:unsaturated chondroitin disaccharide hydrolase|nr:glycoside hydrolase family 88 protein [Bacteroidales bacterium]
MKHLTALFVASLLFSACRNKAFEPVPELDYCVSQAAKTLPLALDYNHSPNTVDDGKQEWRFTQPGSWTCGFWSGILWYIYEYSKDPQWLAAADNFTYPIIPAATGRAHSHDVGFMAYCSIGNGYRLTGNPAYKQALMQAADSVARLFNPQVGTFLSWPNMVKKMDWSHNTIIDNMMNMELLFWASKNGGDRRLYDIAYKHAETTMNNHFRPDFSAYHVIVYNDTTGERIKGVTHQGYADETMWARGQAWAIYGFTMAYRETKDPRFLDVAQKATNIFLKRLPADMIPYWDFDAPAIPDEPRDASAAAITASALLELSILADDKTYQDAAEKILLALSSDEYQSRSKNTAFLLHSVGHKPNESEIDASIIYADYYYIEALLRLKKIREGKSIYENL